FFGVERAEKSGKGRAMPLEQGDERVLLRVPRVKFAAFVKEPSHPQGDGEKGRAGQEKIVAICNGFGLLDRLGGGINPVGESALGTQSLARGNDILYSRRRFVCRRCGLCGSGAGCVCAFGSYAVGGCGFSVTVRG